MKQPKYVQYIVTQQFWQNNIMSLVQSVKLISLVISKIEERKGRD